MRAWTRRITNRKQSEGRRWTRLALKELISTIHGEQIHNTVREP